MITIVILFRNLGRMSADCVRILAESVTTLGLQGNAEFLFVDDASDPGQEVAPLLQQARSTFPLPTRILKFHSRQHYTRGLAHALSAATGDILFISHDMLTPRSYIRGILQVAALNPAFGIIRGVSTYVDCFPQYIVEPPGAVGNPAQLNAFSDYIAERYGLLAIEDDFLTGDSMLIRRSVIDKIGVFDPAYFGYFGDIDYGLRAQRAGFKLICAKGAWLFHQGSGYYVNEAERTQRPPEVVRADRMKVVEAAYAVFRDKWDPTLPPQKVPTAKIPFKALRDSPTGPNLFVPPLTLTPDIGQWL